MRSWRLIILSIALVLGTALPSAAGHAQAATTTVLPPPTTVTAVAGDGSATVSWQAPAIPANYHLAVYQINVYQNGMLASPFHWTAAAGTTQAIVTGLTNGLSYTFSVQAGVVFLILPITLWTQESAQSNAVTPAPSVTPPSPPGAPTSVTAVAGNGSATVSWQAPAIQPGYQLAGYQINVYQNGSLAAPFQVAAVASATQATVTGLTNGSSYTFKVQARVSTLSTPVQLSGWSAESAASNAVVPTAGPVPGQPANVDAHGSSLAAVVTWTAPSSAYAISGYQVLTYQWLGGTTWTPVPGARVSYTLGGTGTIAIVGGLTNGLTYHFTVKAVSSAGWGSESAPSRSITPGTSLPANPSSIWTTAGNTSATVQWVAPTGFTIDHYLIMVYTAGGNLVQYLDAVPWYATSATINGLTNGTSYTINVYAVNTNGMMGSAATTQVTAGLQVPGQPANISVQAGNGQATLSWTAPLSGGNPITIYAVTAYLGATSTIAATTTVGGSATSATITGLTNGTSYTFTVKAGNAVGWSLESVRSGATLLATVPGPPLGVTATAGAGQATVSWSAPASNGGSALTGYTITASTGIAAETQSLTVGAGTTSVTMTGLPPGRSYTFTVTAFNAVGQGGSASFGPVTLGTAPGGVRNLVITPGDASIQVNWDAPASNGGLAITGYQVTASDGVHTPTTVTVTVTSAVLTGLTNGTSYSVSVVARNSVGTGTAVSGLATPRNLPLTLTIPGNQMVQYGNALHLTVTAADAEASDHVTLTASGLPDGLSFVDNGNRTGTITGAIMAPAGTYTVSISGTDGQNPAVTQTFTIVVTRQDAVVHPLISNLFSVAKPQSLLRSITVRSTVSAATAGSQGTITNAAPVTVSLKAMGSGTVLTRTATAVQTSAGTLSVSATFKNLPVNVYRVTLSVGGTYYQGSAYTLFTLYAPSAHGSVSGRGTVAGNAPGRLTFSTKYGANGKLLSSFVYSGHHPEGDFTLTGKIVGGLVIKGRNAYFQGTGSMNGVGGYRFGVAVHDNGRPGLTDQVAVWVTDPNHALVGHCTFSYMNVSGGDTVVSVR